MIEANIKKLRPEKPKGMSFKKLMDEDESKLTSEQLDTKRKYKYYLNMRNREYRMKYYKKNRREIIKRNVICNRLRNIRNKAVMDLSGMKLKRGRPKKVYDLEV